jgi:hypothetical protein
VDSLSSSFLDDSNDVIHVEIALAGGCRANAMSFIGHAHKFLSKNNKENG